MRTLPLLLALLSTPALAAPLTLQHQGRLADATGAPLTGSHALTFALFTEPAGGVPVWTDTLDTELSDGFFTATLGSGTALDLTAFAGTTSLYVELTVDGGAPLARQALASVPFALDAAGVRGGIVDASELRVQGALVSDADGIAWGALRGAPAGLDDGDDDTLADLSCGTGAVAMWDGVAWACGDTTPADLDASVIVSGVLDINRLPVGTSDGSIAPGNHTHDAADVATGVLAVARVPDLDAAKVTTGTFAAARIPNLDAAKVTTGTFNTARIPDLDAGKITSGTLATARLPGLDAAQTVSGVFDPARIPDLDASKITSGTLSKARLPALTATDVGAVPAAGGSVSGGLLLDGTTQQIAFQSTGYARLPTGWDPGPGPTGSPNDGFAIMVAHQANTENTAAFLVIGDNSNDGVFIGGGGAASGHTAWRGLRVQADGSARLTGALASGQGALYADLAENVPVAGGVEAGDVVVVRADARSYPEDAFARSESAYDRGVVGVISDSAIMNMAVEEAGRQPLALSGLVRVKVDASYGAVRPGDLLVSSGTPGHAMRAGDDAPAGTVLGKALEPLDDGTGRVLMLVMPR